MFDYKFLTFVHMIVFLGNGLNKVIILKMVLLFFVFYIVQLLDILEFEMFF